MGWFVTLIYAGYGLNRPVQQESAMLLGAGIACIHLLSFSYAHLWPLSPRWRMLRLVLASVIAALLLPLSYEWLQIDLDRRTTWTIVMLFAPLQILLHTCHSRCREVAPLEPLRWMLAAAGALSLGHPFLTTSTVGTGDAGWYASMIADFTTQWRAGIFPVFVGQSDYAFNGAVSPLRFAPYLQHAAGMVDLVTFHRLSAAGALNLTLFASLLGAALTAYGSLAAIERGTRWLSLLLALLFVSSPGVLALAYTGDLFMSVCALPYIPLVLLGLHRTFTRRDPASVCFLSVSLAAVWLCHPPIAFWLTVVATLGQLLRLVREWRQHLAWKGWLAGALLFGALTLGAFVSVGTLRLPALIVDRLQLVGFLRQAFPDSLLPVSEGAATLSDYQLGWSLWAVLIFAALTVLVRRRPFELTAVGGAAILVLLLLPVPHILESLWGAMPQAVCNLTFYWPMQRLYVLLAALTVFGGYAGTADLVARRPWLHFACAAALLIALQWSWVQSDFFVRRGLLNRGPDAAGILATLTQNRILTRYSYSPFPAYPPYFSHGYVDPSWQNRLIEPGTFRELGSNYRSATGEKPIVQAEGGITAQGQDSAGKFFQLVMQLPVQPNRHYALGFEFRHPNLQGSLLVSGATLAREYYLPYPSVGLRIDGPTTSFGTLPSSQKFLSLTTSSPEPEILLVQFVANETVTTNISDFGRFVLKEYDPAQLPVVIESWTPYRAKVTTSVKAWLETPRMFIEGYAATVNGKSAPVARSAGGLVMLPVEPGESRVTLSYPGPLSLRVAYFVSLLAWIGLGVVLLRAAWRRLRPSA